MSILQVTFTNFSGQTLTRDFWGQFYEVGLTTTVNSPAAVLEKDGGQTTFANDQMFNSLDQGPLEIYCTWLQPSGARFGVRLRAEFQMVTIGQAPHWYVSTDYSTGTAPNWVDSGSDPSIVYSNADWGGIAIDATPTAQHTTLSVDVIFKARS
jgi:hypothetical protein